jgi:hypothetical protein
LLSIPSPVVIYTSAYPYSTSTNPIPDLKNTTDDALPNYLTSLKFKQSHTQTDIRLFLGYSAVAIAGTLFYFDWKQGWDATKAYTAPAVIAYFIINGIFSYWIWAVEKGVVFAGVGKTGKVSFQTQLWQHAVLCVPRNADYAVC